ncbi:GAF domain-containing protein [Leptolyngbya iicbica]|uniref:GAF domain-containing protein n=2 Tax=Cyanophyceae TaxID=3028117 RepID=A0A4Q7EM74_9CYAN|nr:GAF domain-containing protein [Leptolyngbya sp. LK]RZM82909.1 GAF domain-containing protein [Leptolyngbya sp. LK]
MQIPAIPANESSRLAVLYSLKILDTDPEERFDQITRIAQRAFRVPIALVSLIDAERQWFKSCQGFCASETPRDVSFCGHAILEDRPLIVPDARDDPRFHDNPFVMGEPGIRFYAGMPLTVLDGYRLGTLCLIDQQPRTLDTNEELLLIDLGHLVEQELAACKTSVLEELQQRNQEMELLSRLSDFLQASLSLPEAFEVMRSLLNPLFPGCSGSVFTICASRNRVEQGVTWGQHQYSIEAFAPETCWALRRGRSHFVNPERSALQCAHVHQHSEHPTAATLCIPMIAQGETLGLFFISAIELGTLNPALQQLAHTVAEQIALAIANLNLRETLQNQSYQASSS